MSESSKAHPALAASRTDSPNGSYRAGLTKIEALSISPSRAAWDISPRNWQLLAATKPVVPCNSDGPAILIGHSMSAAAEASTGRFFALSHKRPALKTNGSLSRQESGQLSTPFQIIAPRGDRP